MALNDGNGNDTADGFTQNLDLGVVVAAGGIMTTNTGYWGAL
jgi:hypothetical protein